MDRSEREIRGSLSHSVQAAVSRQQIGGRTITPHRLVLSTMASLATKKVESLADLDDVHADPFSEQRDDDGHLLAAALQVSFAGEQDRRGIEVARFIGVGEPP